MSDTVLLSLVLFALGVVMWKVGSLIGPDKKRGSETMSNSREQKIQILRGEITRLSSQVGGLPSLPERPVEFEGWFQDVKKRLEMRSEQRNVIEHVEIAKRFNELHGQWLQLARTDYELSRVNARAKVEDAKITLELKQIEVEMARLDAQLRDLRQAQVQHQTPTSDEDRLRSAFQRAKTIAALHRIQQEELARYANDPEMRDIITRITDDERIRILEGRR